MSDIVDATTMLANYHRWLYKVAQGYTSWGTPIDDVVQEARVAMWRSLGDYDPSKGALPSWVTKAAKMRMRDVVARKTYTGHSGVRGKVKDFPAVPLEPHDEYLLNIPDVAEWQPAAGLAKHRVEIIGALKGLPEVQKEYVYRRFWLDESKAQLDALVGRSHSHEWAQIRPKLQEELRHLSPDATLS